MTRRIAGFAVVGALLAVTSAAQADGPGIVSAPVAPVAAVPQISPMTPPVGVAAEARRVAGQIAGLNPGVVRWDVPSCWQNAGRPWRCVLREWTSDGLHCDGVATIMHVTLENRRTGQVRVLRSWGTRKLRVVYCGV